MNTVKRPKQEQQSRRACLFLLQLLECVFNSLLEDKPVEFVLKCVQLVCAVTLTLACSSGELGWGGVGGWKGVESGGW
jgi:hypothetical protein